MVHTNLFKNEIYLIVTSVISIGVLDGADYFELALAAILILPLINLPDTKRLGIEFMHTEKPDKCSSCK